MSSGAPQQVAADEASFTVQECNELLPLVRTIAAELIERREIYGILVRKQRELERAHTPEGLSAALANLDASIWEQEAGIMRAGREIASYGLTIQTLNPIVVHFPGVDRDVVHCWREDEPRITHQHRRGTADDSECTAAPHTTSWNGRAEDS